MNNLLSYFGLIDAKIRASDKDLPVLNIKVKCESKKDFDPCDGERKKMKIVSHVLFYSKLLNLVGL